MPSCSIIGCGSSYKSKEPKITLHRLPSAIEKRNAWLEIIGAENLNKSHKIINVCSLHFEDSCFNRTLDHMMLRDNALPSRLLPYQMEGVKRNHTGEKVNLTNPQVRLVDCTKRRSTVTNRLAKEEMGNDDDDNDDNNDDDYDNGADEHYIEDCTPATVSVDPLSLKNQKRKRFKESWSKKMTTKLINSLKEENLERKRKIKRLNGIIRRQRNTIAKLRAPNGLYKDSVDQHSSSKPVVIGYVCDDVTEQSVSSGTSKKIQYLDKKDLMLRRVNSVYDNPVYEFVNEDEADCEDKKDKQNTEQSKVEKKIRKLDNEYWKLKLSYILHETQFCGLCQATPDEMNGINDEFDMIINGSTHRRTLYEIIKAIFKEFEDVLSNSRICNKCKTNVIEAYIFIENTKSTSKMLNYHLTELYNKSCYIQNTILNDAEQSDVCNVVFSLENIDHRQINTECYSDNQEETETIDHEDIKPNFFKCMKCNISLSSYRKWKEHKQIHKNNDNKCRICHETFKTSQLLTKHFTLHFQTRCKICQGLVQDGGLLTHLKKCHMSSIYICKKCDVVFYTPVALVVHNNSWHKEGEYQCVNCKKNFDRHDALKIHKCKFACPDHGCGEAPCVHQGYLTSYREQILSLSPRAKCPDCQYVTLNMGQFITHVNNVHLFRSGVVKRTQ